MIACRWSLRAVCWLAGLPLFAQARAQASTQGPAPGRYVEVDYKKVERHLQKEPTYVAQPLYAMFVLDLAGAYRVTAVVDKSAPDAPFYDVLYLDLDADGDL